MLIGEAGLEAVDAGDKGVVAGGASEMALYKSERVATGDAGDNSNFSSVKAEFSPVRGMVDRVATFSIEIGIVDAGMADKAVEAGFEELAVRFFF